MANLDIIPNLKASTVAIGIIDGDDPTHPLVIGGTGFIITDDGFFITATHVLEELMKVLPDYMKKHPKAKLMAIQNVVKKTGSTGKLDIKIYELLVANHLKASENSSYQSSLDLDISIGRFYGDVPPLEHITLKKTQLQVYDEIFMCGYPKGSFVIKQHKLGTTRTSPALQTGRISTIFPYDGTVEPEGIQTDIVGTGGSSGSPIVNANDGEVIAIAQNVLGVSVHKDELLSDGTTTKWIRKDVGVGNTGLTYGITMFFVYEHILDNIKKIKAEYYKDGKIKPEFAKPSTSGSFKI